MTRAGLFLAAAAAGASALSLGVYAMKYEVERLEQRVTALHRALAAQDETLQVLEAEWSYLNRPERLQALATRHLDLVASPVLALGALTEIPFRAAVLPAESRAPLPRLDPAMPSAQAAPAGKWEGT